MSTADSEVRIRPMTFMDLDDIFTVTQEISAAKKISDTYKRFTLEKIFGMDERGTASSQKPDVLEVAKLIDHGLVAQCGGKTCGFVVGRQTYLAELDIQEGEIAIIGVHPDYRGKGVAHRLVDGISDLFLSRGVRRVRVGLIPSDEEMIAFFEKAGFSGEYIMFLSKGL